MARDSFLLRTDPQTLNAIRKWAEDDLRSVNAQIEFLLRKALKDAGRSIRTPPEPLVESPPANAAEPSAKTARDTSQASAPPKSDNPN